MGTEAWEVCVVFVLNCLGYTALALSWCRGSEHVRSVLTALLTPDDAVLLGQARRGWQDGMVRCPPHPGW